MRIVELVTALWLVVVDVHTLSDRPMRSVIFEAEIHHKVELETGYQTLRQAVIK